MLTRKEFLSLILNLLIGGFCFSQTKVITIEKKFEDIVELEEIGTIYLTEIEAGFTLQILSVSGITKAQLMGTSEFTDASMNTRVEVQGGYRYVDLKPKSVGGNFEVKVFKGKESHIVKVKVLEYIKKIDSDCDIRIGEKHVDCVMPDTSNYFGYKNTNILDLDDIVYVYDFNRITSQRRFYKISSEAESLFGKRSFGMRKVNLSKETLTSDRQVWIMMANVNRFSYNVSIEDTLVKYDSEPSALFNRFFLGDSGSLLGTLMTDYEGKIKSQSYAEKFEDVINKIRCFNSMYTSLKAEVIKVYDPCETFICCSDYEFSTIISKRNELENDISILILKVVDKKRDVENLKKERDACEKGIIEMKKLKDRILELKQRKKPKIEEEKELVELKKKVETYKICSEEDRAEIDEKILDLESEISMISGLSEVLGKLPTELNLRAISVFIMNMVEQNRMLLKGPIQLRGNRLDFTLKIATIDSITKLFGYPKYSDSLYYQIPIIWKPFISFSSGSFTTLGQHLQNKTYSWQELTGINNVVVSDKYTLVESGYSNPVNGFAAFGNIEWKASRLLGFGVSVGVGLTIERDPRVAGLAGLSLFLGDSRQFAFTVGLAGMQVDKLNNNWQNVSDKQVIYTTEPQIEYYKEGKTGVFMAISYTPFKSTRDK